MSEQTRVSNVIRKTISICPVCRERIPAFLDRDNEGVWLEKECSRHGRFRTIVWRDYVDLEDWIRREEPLEEDALCSCSTESCSISEGTDNCCGDGGEASCYDPDDCICSLDQGSCCVLLEVTSRCNLNCTYCFAHGGERDLQPSFEELCRRIDIIAEKGGGPLLQLTGGEPTLRDDLPELAAYAKKAGCAYTQINTNGIRLAEDEDYVRRLAEAGVDIVFLQFDGTDDVVYRKLRGRDLLDVKLAAIANCDRYKIGVTLVPTIVRGINDSQLGNIIRKAIELFPAVRSVHFQPVTYMGRYPESLDLTEIGGNRYTLDELMHDLSEQTGIPVDAFIPSRCDHAMCEFHSTFTLNDKRQLVPMTSRRSDTRAERTTPAENRRYVAEHWSRQEPENGVDGHLSHGMDESLSCRTDEHHSHGTDEHISNGAALVADREEDINMDEFLYRMKHRSMKISAMAFQDEMNIDLERLSRCSLHVYDDGEILPFCAKYLGLGREMLL